MDEKNSYSAVFAFPRPWGPAVRLRIQALACGAVRVTRTLRDVFLPDGGDVVVTVGFDAAGTILNVDANVSTETQGVGSKVGERAILDRFTGISGNANDVTLRSGATYTSNAVRSSVNAAFEAVAAVIG